MKVLHFGRGPASDRMNRVVTTYRWDPAKGKFIQREYETATRIIDELGVDLKRASDGSADWVDDAGKTYDAVGPFDGKYFAQQWNSLKRQITWHLNYEADLVPVDVSEFSADQILQIKQFIAPLGERVFLVGE